MTNINATRMDKTAFQIADLCDESDARDYWKRQTPDERLLALETLRQVMYGYDPLTTRLQRFFEVAEFPCN